MDGGIRAQHTNMKILFIHEFDKPDYLPDSIYHGLVDLGFEVHTTSIPSNLYEETVVKKHCHNLYGKLKGSPRIVSSQDLYTFFVNQYYDFIIYGNIRSDHRFFWSDRVELSKLYNKNQVHFLDGEDDPFVLTGLLEYGILWKRELTDERAEPIGFSIPESQLVESVIEKTQLLGSVIPGVMHTYTFPIEDDYNLDYRKSYYGITTKKAGWDCVRHYEILANRCIPLFPDIEQCPEKTLFYFPKNLIIESNKYSIKGEVHPRYFEILEELFEYTKENLTTKKMAMRIINFKNK
jgi:hypothetical protein